MTRRGDSWWEWLALLLLLGFAVAFVGLVMAFAVALCCPKPPTDTNDPSGLSPLRSYTP